MEKLRLWARRGLGLVALALRFKEWDMLQTCSSQMHRKVGNSISIAKLRNDVMQLN